MNSEMMPDTILRLKRRLQKKEPRETDDQKICDDIKEVTRSALVLLRKVEEGGALLKAVSSTEICDQKKNMILDMISPIAFPESSSFTALKYRTRDLFHMVKNMDTEAFMPGFPDFVIHHDVIRKDTRILGDFFLVMDEDKALDSGEYLELYLTLLSEVILSETRDSHENAEIEIDESELDSRGIATFEWDIREKRLYFSSKWYSMLGYRKEDFIDHPNAWTNIWHPEDIIKNTETLEKYFAGKGRHFELMHRLRTHNGDYSWVLSRGYILRDEKGCPYRLMGINVDVSQAQEESIDSFEERDKLANIIEATNAGTWEWNIQTGETVYNERWAEMLGYTLEELSPITEATYRNLVHPDDYVKSNEEIENLFTRKKEYYSLTCRMKHKKGHWVWVLDKGKVVSWTEDEKPLYVFGTHIDITESKLLEMEIKESEDKYRFLVESSYDIVYRISRDGIFTFLSRAWENILGIPVEEAIGKPFPHYVYPEDVPKLHDFFSGIEISGERNETKDYRLLHNDGTYRWFTTNAVPIRDGEGNVTEFAGTARDITEVKAANLALIAQKNELERFFNVNIDLFCISDEWGNFKKVNLAWNKILGYDIETLSGQNILDYIHPDDLDMLRTAMGKMNRDKEEVIFVIRLLQADGGYRTMEWKAQSSGSLIYAAARDVTENKILENNLFIEKEFFRTTLLSVGDGVISTDSRGRVTLMNTVAERMTGWTLYNALGRPVDEVLKVYHPETGKAMRDRTREILNRGKKRHISEMILVSVSGKESLIEDSASPIMDNGGNITGMVLVFRDITEKKKREEKIRFMSYHDSLTGLYNRRYMKDAIKRMETTRNLPFTVMVMDLNALKITNDAFGHQIGDELLLNTARILESVCRETDVLARVGGDEFVLLLPRTTSEEAERIKGRILEETDKAFVGPVCVSLAIGHATKTGFTQNILEIQKVADNNMYKDKLKKGKAVKANIVKTILRLIDERFPSEKQHLINVAHLVEKTGRAMSLSEIEIDRVKWAAKLHDIGKISVPHDILTKSAKLTFEEYEVMKKHVETSYQILKSVEEYAGFAEDVLYHHERMDGNGYPEGLKGDEIPINARILAVCDAYEAMTGERVYQAPVTSLEAAEELIRCSGTQFDPMVVDVFVREVVNGLSDIS